MDNKYMVGMRGSDIVIMNPNCRILSKDDALHMAAWLFVMSGKTVDEFELMVREVEQ